MFVLNQWVRIMNFSQLDEQHMRHALELAALGRFSTSPNPRVGCVIARGEQVVGVGFHVRAGEPHAEVHALRHAGDLACGATVYVTLEPCAHFGRTPPCVQALLQAGVARVVAAMRDPNPLVAGKGLEILAEGGVCVEYGLCEMEARVLNRGFLSRMERHRPFICAKIAASLDGKTALSDGRSQWITGEAARHDVQQLRARSGAILTGIDTVLVDNPRLNVRDVVMLRQPIRVLLDRHFRLPENSHVVQDGGETWVFSMADAPMWVENYVNVRVFRYPGNLADVLAILAQNQVDEVLLEAGATLTSAMMMADLVDEIVLYQATKFLGEAGRNAFRLPENEATLSGNMRWQTIECVRIGDDMKWVLQRKVR